jgi:hypothetical protein
MAATDDFHVAAHLSAVANHAIEFSHSLGLCCVKALGKRTICQFGSAIEISAPIVRHLISRRALRQICATAMDEWREVAAD